MREEIRYYKSKMPKAQKLRFFKYVFERLNSKVKINFGLCGIYYDYFGMPPENFELIPELRKHKPKTKFYDYQGKPSEFSDQFWFPPNDDESRIELCKQVLEEIKK